MSDRVRVVWDDALRAYDFGPGHPLAPIRVQLAMRLSGDFGLLNRPNVTVAPPSQPITDADLLRVHDAEYIEAVRRAGNDPSALDLLHGLGTPDVPSFPDMHEASAAVCAATVDAARSGLEGGFDHAVNLAGGLHHAMPAMASGFCVYNDIGVAIAWLLDHGVERVGYVDVDVHHGDGVQAMFYDDPRVMTISLHETGRTLFPGTGYPTEVGGKGAEGTSINVALPAGTGDNAWLRAFQAVVPQALEAFRPQVLVTQQGCDVVPRAWTHLMAEAVGAPLDPSLPTPQTFRDLVVETVGRPAPGHMTDGADPWVKSFESGYDPGDSVDRAILATREATFPLLGLTADPFSPF